MNSLQLWATADHLNGKGKICYVFSFSAQGKDELLGRSICKPIVKLNSNMDQMPKLLWHPIIQNGRKAGETLVAAELILKDKARVLYMNSVLF